MESRHQLWSLDINYGNFGHHLDFIWNLDINLDINNEVLDHKLWTSIINIENCKTMEQHYCNTGELRNDDSASSSSYIERTADLQDNCITGTAGNTQLANLLNYKKPQHRGIAE